MNLNKLFEIQEGLDYHIKKEKGLEGQDLLDMKILALQVELGELANEWRGFKFWSSDQEPRNKGAWKYSTGIENGKFIDVYENPLLEEYVDCLHFILSIGLDVNVKNFVFNPHKEDNIISQFNELNYQTYRVLQTYGWGKLKAKTEWRLLVDIFTGLGDMLGFSTEQIEQAYLDKNKINHARQANGY